jgi:hypothetical protein
VFYDFERSVMKYHQKVTSGRAILKWLFITYVKSEFTHFMFRIPGTLLAHFAFIGCQVYIDDEHPDHVKFLDGAEIALRSI